MNSSSPSSNGAVRLTGSIRGAVSLGRRDAGTFGSSVSAFSRLPPEKCGGACTRQNRAMRPARANFTSLAAVATIVLAVVVVSVGYWPGIMIDDTRWQYQQSVDNSYEDWHPPLMAWIWRRLMFIQPGPAPMFVLQLLLLWVGIGLVAYWAVKEGRPRLALAVALCGWLPASMALSGTVTKDCLMSGALMTATGLALLRDLAPTRAASLVASLASLGFIVFAAALRLNAVVACVPLLIAILPRQLNRTKLRILGSGVVGALMLLAVGPAISAALQAEHTDVDLSLIIFDLGGITEHSGTDVFPDLNVRDPVAVNHRCYDPTEWDSYSTWAKHVCPVGFEAFQNAKDENDLNPVWIWLTAIVHHPLAYAAHRIQHFNLSSAFLVHRGPEFTAWSQSVPNPWGYRVHSKVLIPALTALANAFARTPLGWPIFWISVALAALVGGVNVRAHAVIIALACSSFLYGLTYLVLGVAVGMRYYSWTMSGAAMAAALVISELTKKRGTSSRSSLALIATIAGLPAALAILSRAFA